MENNNKINYLNNGRTLQPYPVHATKIKKTKNIYNSINHGKAFSEKLSQNIELNKTSESSQNKQEKNNVFSWILNTINPLNHIPIVSTLHKLSDRTNKSLDIVQAAIGGAIYGGGPIGLAKGVGGWFINRIIPKNQIAIKKKSINNNEVSKTNNDEISNKIDKKNIKPIVSNYNEKENINTINSFSNFKSSTYKPIPNYYFYNYSNEDKKNKNEIDVDA